METSGLIVDEELALRVCQHFNQLVKGIMLNEYDDICNLIKDSNRIFIYGVEDVDGEIAQELRRILLSNDKYIYELYNLEAFKYVSEIIADGDIIILISTNDNIDGNSEIFHVLKLNSIPVITITKYEKSNLPIKNNGNLCIYRGYENELLRENEYECKTLMPFFAILEVLCYKYKNYRKDIGGNLR